MTCSMLNLCSWGVLAAAGHSRPHTVRPGACVWDPPAKKGAELLKGALRPSKGPGGTNTGSTSLRGPHRCRALLGASASNNSFLRTQNRCGHAEVPTVTLTQPTAPLLLIHTLIWARKGSGSEAGVPGKSQGLFKDGPISSRDGAPDTHGAVELRGERKCVWGGEAPECDIPSKRHPEREGTQANDLCGAAEAGKLADHHSARTSET